MSNNDRQKSKVKNIIKIVFVVLYQVLVIFALLLTFVIVLQRISSSNQSLGGIKIFRVLTGSMEPEYDIGEVVISKEVDPKDIKVGDDIVYLGKNGDYAGKIIMHNVIAIDTDESGNLNFHAKGLHTSSMEDPEIKANQIYGVVIFKSKLLTILYDLATNVYSIFAIIIILALNVFIAFNTPKKTRKRKVKRIANPVIEEEYEEEPEEEFIEEFEPEEEIIENNEQQENEKQFDVDKLITEKMKEVRKSLDEEKTVKIEEKLTKKQTHKETDTKTNKATSVKSHKTTNTQGKKATSKTANAKTKKSNK